jgi:2-haloacid dehalogenase
MKSKFPYVTFDCYGTLVDWESGIKSTIKTILDDKGVRGNIEQLFRTREDLEFDLIQSEYRAYREILALSLKETFAQFQLPYSNRDGERLAESVPDWPVFPDTVKSLGRIGRVSRVCIISNIDKDIIRKTRDKMGVRFDLIITAQEARSYKPNIRPFQMALGKLKARSSEILHVSSGFRYDIPPAHQLGFNTAWINRKGEKAPVNFSADYEFSDLSELAEFLERNEVK